MNQRDNEIQQFFKSAKITPSPLTWLANDASGRRYARLQHKNKSYILMDSPLNENPDQFYRIDQLLLQTRILAPKIYHADLDHGLLLLEDFGPTPMSQNLTTTKERLKLYKQALDILIQIQTKILDKPDFVPQYTTGYWTFEENLMTDWFVPAILGTRLPVRETEKFKKIWAKLNKKIQKIPTSLVLLDYHADNLMITPNHKLGVLDFQDARWGTFIYDVVSLLEDERHPLPKNERQQLWQYYLDKIQVYKKFKLKKIQQAIDLISVQRHTKVIGIFTRLAIRDKKEKYIHFLPDSWALMEEHLQNPIFKSYQKWLDKHIPNTYHTQIPKFKKFPYMTTAMILAAGRGVRMKNLTDHQPKPLVKVNGKSLISYVLNHARHMTNIVVNTCYCGQMIHTELSGKKVHFSDEKIALETGGGVQNALPLLTSTGKDGFFVINSDALWLDKKIPLLKQMENVWNPLKMDILLALVPTRKAKGDVPKGDYFIKNDHPIRRHPPIQKAPYCFMGVQILHPDIFNNHPHGKYSLVELYDKAEQSGRLACLVFDGQWFHVGTPEAVNFTTKYFQRKHV